MSQIERKWLETGYDTSGRGVGPQQIGKDAFLDLASNNIGTGDGTHKIPHANNVVFRTGDSSMLSDLNLGGYKITNLASPSGLSDAVTLGYFYSYSQSFAWKTEVPSVSARDGSYGWFDGTKHVGSQAPAGPQDGWMVWVEDVNTIFAFADDTGWVKAGQTPTIPYANDSTAGKLFLADNNDWSNFDSTEVGVVSGALRNDDSRLWHYSASGPTYGVVGDATISRDLKIGRDTTISGELHMGSSSITAPAGLSLTIDAASNLSLVGNSSVSITTGIGGDATITMSPPGAPNDVRIWGDTSFVDSVKFVSPIEGDTTVSGDLTITGEISMGSSSITAPAGLSLTIDAASNLSLIGNSAVNITTGIGGDATISMSPPGAVNDIRIWGDTSFVDSVKFVSPIEGDTTVSGDLNVTGDVRMGSSTISAPAGLSLTIDAASNLSLIGNSAVNITTGVGGDATISMSPPGAVNDIRIWGDTSFVDSVKFVSPIEGDTTVSGDFNVTGDVHMGSSTISAPSGLSLTLDAASTLSLIGNSQVNITTGVGGDATIAMSPPGAPNAVRITGLTQFVGNVDVTGNLTKSSGSFKIDHPIKESTYLLHGFVESPEYGLIYRGSSQLTDFTSVVDLPYYFEALTKSEKRTVSLTCRDGWSPIYVQGSISDKFKVVSLNGQGDPNQKFDWIVGAVRNDAFVRNPDNKFTDDDGNMLIEMPKE